MRLYTCLDARENFRSPARMNVTNNENKSQASFRFDRPFSLGSQPLFATKIDVAICARYQKCGDEDATFACEWLRTCACLHPKILQPTILKLEEAEVFFIDDLRMLHDAGRLEGVCKTMTALKISAALDAGTAAVMRQPTTRPPQPLFPPPLPGRLPHPATNASSPMLAAARIQAAW